MNIVISQSMYFPWIGLLEQVRLADTFVHYDDVQYTRGFYNRVQVRTAQGVRWMSIPLREQHRGQRIDQVMPDDRMDWRAQHKEMLRQTYRDAPYASDMLALVDRVFEAPANSLAALARASTMAVAEYFQLNDKKRFVDSLQLDIRGSSSQRLHDIVMALNGTTYITGHGARNYLDHELFARSGIDVRYMRYAMTPYPQVHGGFTPFVTSLDLIANCGPSGRQYIDSDTVDWKEFLREPH